MGKCRWEYFQCSALSASCDIYRIMFSYHAMARYACSNVLDKLIWFAKSHIILFDCLASKVFQKFVLQRHLIKFDLRVVIELMSHYWIVGSVIQSISVAFWDLNKSHLTPEIWLRKRCKTANPIRLLCRAQLTLLRRGSDSVLHCSSNRTSMYKMRLIQDASENGI